MSEWQSPDTAPEDENVILAATGGFVGEAYWIDEGDGPVWYWANGDFVHPNNVPVAWMAMPEWPVGFGAGE